MIDSLERALAELRAEVSPSSADKARLRARIVAPALAAEITAPPPAPLSRWGALKATGSVGLATGALLLGAGAGGGFWLGRAASAPSASPPAAIEPSAALQPMRSPAPPPLDPRPASGFAPEPPERRTEAELAPLAAPAFDATGASALRSPPPRARVARKSDSDRLNDELALLRRVERALRNGAPALALALLGELDERFPVTRLVEERQAARPMAGCHMHDRAAIARARAFLHDNPASVYRQRVQAACENAGPAAPKHPDDAPLKDAVRAGH